MRAALLVLALISAAAAAYFAWDRGASDFLAIGMIAIAVLAAVGFNLTPAARNNPPLRSANARQRDLSPEVSQPHAVREELSELTGSLEAIAEARETANEAAIGGSHVTVSLTAVGRNQIAVIKVLRAHLGLGLKEAKHLSDLARKGQRPQIAVNMPAPAARQLAADISAAGGETEFA